MSCSARYIEDAHVVSVSVLCVFRLSVSALGQRYSTKLVMHRRMFMLHVSVFPNNSPSTSIGLSQQL